MTEFPVSLDALMKRLKRKLARDGQRIRKVRGGTRAVLIDQGGVRTIGGPCFELVNQSGDAIRVLDLAEVIDMAAICFGLRVEAPFADKCLGSLVFGSAFAVPITNAARPAAASIFRIIFHVLGRARGGGRAWGRAGGEN